MLDIEFIKENRKVVEAAIKNKNRDAIDLEKVVNLYEERKVLQTEIDEINRKRNIAQNERNFVEGKALKIELQSLEEKYNHAHKQLVELLLQVPNIPSADTPVGPDESGNKVIRTWGDKTVFPFVPKEHWELGKDLDLIDNERAARVSGSRFTYLKGDIVMLQFALLQFAFSILTNEEKLKEIADAADIKISTKPFIPVMPPDMVKPSIMNAMGRLDPPEDKFYLEKDDLYLAGSAEHALGPMHMGETFTEAELPIRYVGYSSAFRREAGSYGKDTKGIIRVHQFDKSEMETFCLPEEAYREQDFIVAIQEYLMKELRLPYQVVQICTGDMGFPDHRQIDIETYIPGQDRYMETQTSDLIGGFQPRRLNIKVKRESGKSEYVHMNDATVFSMRPLVAILENFQNEDGSVRIPKVLQAYMGKEVITKRS